MSNAPEARQRDAPEARQAAAQAVSTIGAFFVITTVCS
jgi:hypothetical protein